MTIKVILTDKECFALAAQVTTILADAHIKTEQAVDVLCGALAMVLAANDLSLEEIRAISTQTLPKTIFKHARQFRDEGLQYHPAPLQ
jgi:hypothetical protein